MKLEVISMREESLRRVLRPYILDGIPTIGAFGDEPFALRFTNSSGQLVQVRISLDGTDVLTGEKATLDPQGKMWVIGAHSTFELQAWPETMEGGAAFVFTDASNSVALHTHGDLGAKGYISAAVFVEGYKPPRPQFTTRGGGSPYLERFSSTRGGPSLRGIEDFDFSVRGPAIGAGQHTEQRIRSVTGLSKPQYSELVQLRYLWWDDVMRLLLEQGMAPQHQHPTGFASQKMADLGSTPRIGSSATQVTEGTYSRLM